MNDTSPIDFASSYSQFPEYDFFINFQEICKKYNLDCTLRKYTLVPGPVSDCEKDFILMKIYDRDLKFITSIRLCSLEPFKSLNSEDLKENLHLYELKKLVSSTEDTISFFKEEVLPPPICDNITSIVLPWSSRTRSLIIGQEIISLKK